MSFGGFAMAQGRVADAAANKYSAGGGEMNTFNVKDSDDGDGNNVFVGDLSVQNLVMLGLALPCVGGEEYNEPGEKE
jgi:hypothetical protein